MIPSLLLALALSPADVDRLLAEGRQLSANPLQRLEQRLGTEPDNAAIRVQLLAWYTENASTAGVESAKAARADHILWLIAYDPHNPVLVHRSGVAQLHCAGDELADPAASEKAKDLWLGQVAKSPAHKAAAARYLRFCYFEEAIQLEAQPEYYADAALGITGLDYMNSDPAASDPKLRNSAAGEKARAWLAETMHPKALHRFLYFAALLRSQDRLDWDYTAYAAPLLAKARAASPAAVELYAVSASLPESGARPADTVWVEEGVQSKALISGPSLVAGVRFAVLIDPQGRVVHAAPQSGAPDEIAAGAEALKQRVYRPTKVQGKAVYVVTSVSGSA